jgi:hypothetical protein
VNLGQWMAFYIQGTGGRIIARHGKSMDEPRALSVRRVDNPTTPETLREKMWKLFGNGLEDHPSFGEQVVFPSSNYQ